LVREDEEGVVHDRSWCGCGWISCFQGRPKKVRRV